MHVSDIVGVSVTCITVLAEVGQPILNAYFFSKERIDELVNDIKKERDEIEYASARKWDELSKSYCELSKRLDCLWKKMTWFFMVSIILSGICCLSGLCLMLGVGREGLFGYEWCTGLFWFVGGAIVALIIMVVPASVTHMSRATLIDAARAERERVTQQLELTDYTSFLQYIEGQRAISVNIFGFMISFQLIADVVFTIFGRSTVIYVMILSFLKEP